MGKNLLTYFLLLIAAVVVAGIAGAWLHTDLEFAPSEGGGLPADFWPRFQMLFVLAVLIERSVEVYLKATSQDGIENYQAETHTVVKTKDAQRPATIAALVISLLVAMSGVRLIETLVELQPNSGFWKTVVWHGVDVFVSAGLMAGGADLFHKLAEVLVGGLERAKFAVKGQTNGGVPSTLNASAGHLALTASAAAHPYAITVSRPKDSPDTGTLEFKDGGVTISTICWWAANNRIDPGVYTRCSKTVMFKLKHRGIYLPDAKSKVTGNKEIFIHSGSDPADSLGCIAVKAADFTTLYNHIQPADGFNITVTVVDV